MTITSSGPICDVCAKYILPPFDDSVNPFEVGGIDQVLHCHDRCKAVVEEMSEKQDWRILPEGPLRRCYEENYKDDVKEDKKEK